MIDTQIEGKVVLITGANHGIGAAASWNRSLIFSAGWEGKAADGAEVAAEGEDVERGGVRKLRKRKKHTT